MTKILALVIAVSSFALASCESCCKSKKETTSCCPDGKVSACCAPGAKSDCKECDMGSKADGHKH